MNVDTVVEILKIVEAAEPGVIQIIGLFKHADGDITVLDATHASAEATLKQIAEWKASHNVK